MSKIIKLVAENVKKLKAVEITPTGDLVVISGANGAGKSSVMDALWATLAGKPDLEQPVRAGEERAVTSATIGPFEGLGTLVVRRTITPAGGGTLTVTTEDGRKQPMPQTLLDSLLGKLTFDPLAFVREKPKRQAEILRELVGLDFKDHDCRRQKLYDDRTLAGRDADSLAARLSATKYHDDMPLEEVSSAEVLAKIQAGTLHNEKVSKARAAVVNHGATLAHLQQQQKTAASEVVRLQAALSAAVAREAGLRDRIAEQQGVVQQAEQAVQGLAEQDLTSLRQDLDANEAVNRCVRENKQRAALAADTKAKQTEYENLTAQLAAMDAEKAAKIAAANFPVEGMSFSEDGRITIKGIPFSQCCTSDQIKVSLAVGAMLNPRLRVMLVRAGNDLDANSMKELAEAAHEAGLQLWIERIAEDQFSSVVIEDGEVRSR